MPNPLVKPYLKWAGGKRQLLPEIKKYLPQKFSSYKYYEPFLGAGAVFFDKQPSKAVVNDHNEQLILTYKVIRDSVNELIDALKIHSEKNNDEYYYEIRAKDRETETFNKLSDIEKAARLIFLNKTCYNGLYRVNAQGLFNAPYGKYKNPAICDESVLKAIHKYLATHDDIKIISGDFATAAQTADSNSFVYFDPPYHSTDNTNFTGYQADKFDENEQRRLCAIYTILTENGVKCLLSNSDTAFIRDLYSDNRFEIITVTAKRAINSNASGRGDVNELLIKNWR